MSQDVFVVIEHLQGQVADISYLMLAAARQLSQGSSCKVAAILLGHNAKELSADLAADQVLYADDPVLADFNGDAYQAVLKPLISDRSPRAVLFGHTTIGMDTAGQLSAGLSLPLVGSCLTLSSEGKFTSQICGGKIMAEGDLPTPIVLVTMVPGGYKAEQGKSDQAPPVEALAVPPLENLRLNLKGYIQPQAGDVDITKEQFLISIGRGIQNKDNVELVAELAQALGGQICASRPVVDQGWLPTSRLVGKSGKRVSPKVYLALGISGAPEHVEGMDGSETIIAVNTDPHAPIFNVAKYGTHVDMFELITALSERIKQTA